MVHRLVLPTDLWACVHVMWTCVMKVRYRWLGCSFQSCEGTHVRVAIYGNGVTACAAKSFVVTVIVVVMGVSMQQSVLKGMNWWKYPLVSASYTDYSRLWTGSLLSLELHTKSSVWWHLESEYIMQEWLTS